MANGVHVFQRLAQDWTVGGMEPPTAGAGTPSGGSPSDAQCWQHRQSVGQDQSKGGVRGYDAGKKVNGRKRHLIVDTMGLVLKAFVSEASYQDGVVACWLLLLLPDLLPRLKVLWADGAYRGSPVDLADTLGKFRLETIERDPTKKGFQRLPKRWVVERTFAWLSFHRRLSRDYEYLLQTSDAMIYAVMVRLMLRRLANSP